MYLSSEASVASEVHFYTHTIMKQLLFLLALSTLGLSACKKTEDVAKGTTACIKQKVQLFAKGSLCKTEKNATGASVKEYSFQNKVVYVFDMGSCVDDGSADVLDENCQNMGFLGGLVGNNTINGEPFSNAEFKRVIWQK